jgi:hypothetical protein
MKPVQIGIRDLDKISKRMDSDPISAIRLDPDTKPVLWSCIQEGKKDPEKQKTANKFHLLKCWMFSF